MSSSGKLYYYLTYESYEKINRLSNIKGIYPIGEGAGYAGGIMSSAIDGLKCSEVLLKGER